MQSYEKDSDQNEKQIILHQLMLTKDYLLEKNHIRLYREVQTNMVELDAEAA
jgi:hypothetical protein